jgi:DNA-binding transcriptional LysR family regulator
MTLICESDNFLKARSFMLNTLSTRPANLAALDLNLLVVFDAVFAERHISRASLRLRKSQPAVSGALARLRSLLNDPLFVRDGAGVRPTRLARELARPIQEALQLLNESLRRDRDFASATSNRTFRLNLNDYTQTILLPRLLAQLKDLAPNVRLATTSLPMDEMESALKRGVLDLAVDCHVANPTGLYQQRLFDDEFVCLVRKGHPQVRGSLTRGQFVTFRHGVIKHGPVPGLIERLLTKAKVKRDALITFPHCLLAPFIAARTDLIVTVPKREALDFMDLLPLRMFPPPHPMGQFTVRAFWSEEGHRDPANRWLRATLKEICSQL